MTNFLELLQTMGRGDDIIAISHKEPVDGSAMLTDWVRLPEIPDLLARLSGAHDVWFAVNPMTRPAKGRGGSRDVTGLVALWIDLDFASDAKANGLSPTQAGAVLAELSEIVGHKPNAVVKSGHGLQPYWYFESPIDPALGAALLLRWRALVIDVATRHGGSIDTGVYDLPRILRVPGPPNLKYGQQAATSLVLLGADTLTYPCITEILDRHTPNTLSESNRPVASTDRDRTYDPEADRVFDHAEALVYLEEQSFALARNTPWGAGSDYWMALWQAADQAARFIGMFEESWLREQLADAIAEGHDGVGPNADDEYQINRAFSRLPDWLAREPNDRERDDVWSRYCTRQPAQVHVEQQGDIDPSTAIVYVDSTGSPVPPPPPLASTDHPFSRASSIAPPRPPAGPVVNYGPERTLIATQLSSIKPRSAQWLWKHEREHWIPRIGLVLLGGRESVGKSTWTARLVAQVTNGKMEGVHLNDPKSVIVCATEDDFEYTIAPRLLAAGADMTRVWRVEVGQDEAKFGLTLPTDVPKLQRMIEEHDVALVVLDPLLGTISGKLNTHVDAEVRVALEPITRMASEAKVCVLGLIHTNKTSGGSADISTRLMGSRAFIAVARAALVCTYEGEEAVGDIDIVDGGESRSLYLFAQIKSNLGPKVKHAIRYTIEDCQAGFDDDLNEPVWSSRVKVLDYNTGKDIEEVELEKEAERKKKSDGRYKADGESKQDKCANWLGAYLCHGKPVPSQDVKAEAEVMGFKHTTLAKAVKDAGVHIERTGFGATSATLWSIPIAVPAEADEWSPSANHS